MNTYFGTLRRRLQTMHLSVGEYSYPAHCRIERHTHELPFVSLVLEGSYRERVGSVVSEIDGPTAVVHAAGERHQDEFGAARATIFSVDMPRDWFEAAAARSHSVNTGPHVTGAIRLIARELARAAHGAEWFVESAVLHLMGSVARTRRTRKGTPGWMRHIEEFLQDNYARKVPLAELAAIAGVHPVHLARQFHKTFACTVGEYVRAVRVERALEDLLHGERSLADIAAAHGFADQSHLSRLVRSRTGRTPGDWRGRRASSHRPRRRD